MCVCVCVGGGGYKKQKIIIEKRRKRFSCVYACVCVGGVVGTWVVVCFAVLYRQETENIDRVLFPVSSENLKS